MKEAFGIASAIIASIGGAGAIIIGLSSWLGKVWANRILENQKKEHQMEIESFKSQLQENINKVNAVNEKALHISKTHYDTEFGIYKEIWVKLLECIKSVNKLYPPGFSYMPSDPDEIKRMDEKNYKKFAAAYNDFSNTITKYAPFYKKDFYDNFIIIRNLCDEKSRIFENYNFDDSYNESCTGVRDSKLSIDDKNKAYIEIPEKLKGQQDKLQEDIRDYLASLEIR